MAKKFLTLNIGASSVALAEYESSGSSLTLVNYGTAALAAPLDSGDADAILSPAILSIVREKGIKPGKVAISLSGQMVFPRFAAIPFAGGDEQKFDQALVGAGFQPEIVDVAPLAVMNALKASAGDDGGCVVMLDIGAKTTSLVISEGEKLYNRSIPVAGNTLTKEIAQTLGCTQAEAEQIKRESAYVSLGGVTEDEDETLDRISKVCRAVLTRLHAEISRSINFYRSQQGRSCTSPAARRSSRRSTRSSATPCRSRSSSSTRSTPSRSRLPSTRRPSPPTRRSSRPRRASRSTRPDARPSP